MIKEATSLLMAVRKWLWLKSVWPIT